MNRPEDPAVNEGPPMSQHQAGKPPPAPRSRPTAAPGPVAPPRPAQNAVSLGPRTRRIIRSVARLVKRAGAADRRPAWPAGSGLPRGRPQCPTASGDHGLPRASAVLVSRGGGDVTRAVSCQMRRAGQYVRLRQEGGYTGWAAPRLRQGLGVWPGALAGAGKRRSPRRYLHGGSRYAPACRSQGG